jgi:TonB family protein
MRIGGVVAVMVMLGGPVWAGSRDPKATKHEGTTGHLSMVQVSDVVLSVGSVLGRLTRKGLSQAVSTRLRDLNACVAHDPKLAGRLELGLRVTARLVRVTRGKSTLGDRQAEACLLRQVRSVQYGGQGRARLTLLVRQFALTSSLGPGAGGLGLRGHGGGKPPTIRSGQPIIGHGPLPRDVIRRVIRTHLGEVRRCYEQQLVKRPTLAGTVVVQFTVAADGTVSAARVSSSTIASPAVGQCLVRRILSWAFPRPRGGGIVKVSYPFVFRASDGAAPAKPKPAAEAPPRP